jgi:hypothetical protein
MGEIWEARGALEESRAFWERALYCRREVGALRIGHVHGTMPTALLAVARVAAKQGDLATERRAAAARRHWSPARSRSAQTVPTATR